MTRKIRLDVQYVGTRYAGWQYQPDRSTIQGSLEGAVAAVLQGAVRIHGSGRTDAGVHARGQVAHFETLSTLSCERLLGGVNHHLPWDIRVVAARDAPPEFHARSSSISKQYRYRVHRGSVMPPHVHPFALLVTGSLDRGAMHEAAARLVGTHDFASLRVTGGGAVTTVRTVLRSEWMEEGPEMIYVIEADGFLYKMVRTIVGILLEIGRGVRSPASMTFESGPHPPLARPVVAARGLHLWRVNYGSGIWQGTAVDAPGPNESTESMGYTANSAPTAVGVRLQKGFFQ